MYLCRIQAKNILPTEHKTGHCSASLCGKEWVKTRAMYLFVEFRLSALDVCQL
jgi:hypothetical protein